jgi:hypothetical protein
MQLLNHTRNFQHLMTQDVHYRLHKSPLLSLYPGPDDSNPHPLSYCLNIHFNIIFPFTDTPSSFRFSYQIRICNHHLSYAY